MHDNPRFNIRESRIFYPQQALDIRMTDPSCPVCGGEIRILLAIEGFETIYPNENSGGRVNLRNFLETASYLSETVCTVDHSHKIDGSIWIAVNVYAVKCAISLILNGVYPENEKWYWGLPLSSVISHRGSIPCLTQKES